MPKRVKFLAIVPKTDAQETTYHAYFYCKYTQQIVDVKVNPKIVDFVVKHTKGDSPIKPTILKVLKRLKIRKIILKTENSKKEEKGYCEDWFALIRIKEGCFKKDYIFPLYTGFLLSQLLNVPVEIENRILQKRGIYITKEILNASLSEKGP